MRVNQTPRIKADPPLVREIREHATLLNLMTDGRLAGTNNTATSAPTGGSYAVGDFVRNSAPSELGAVASKYIIFGWLCTDDSPLTFVQCRFLTGN